MASLAVQKNGAAQQQAGRDVDEPDRKRRREQLTLVDRDAGRDDSGQQQQSREESLLHPQVVRVEVLVPGRARRCCSAHEELLIIG